jgi:hypothetical protein
MMMNQVHADVSNTDCLGLYPLNNGSDFHVVLDETLVLTSGHWHVALVGLTAETTEAGLELRGKELYLCSNIVDYSVVGGKKVSLLRKMCLGNGIRTAGGGCVFFVDTSDNNCFYKRVNSKEIKHIRIYVTDRNGQKLDALNDYSVAVTLHFKLKTLK